MNREALHCIPQNVHYLNRREFLRPNIPFHPSKCRREAIIFVFFEDLGQKGKFSNTRMISVSEFLSISLLFPPLLPLSLQNIGRDFRHRVLDLIIISEWLLLDRKTTPKVTFEPWESAHPHIWMLSFYSICVIIPVLQLTPWPLENQRGHCVRPLSSTSGHLSPYSLSPLALWR